MPDPPEAARAVDDGHLVQLGVYALHGRKVDDGGPSGHLPGVADDHDGAEPAFVRKEENRLAAQGHDRLVHDTRLGAEDIYEHGADHHPGQEMRQVGHRLDDPLEAAVARFVDHHRQQDGNGELENEAVQVDQQGIGEDLEKLFRREELPEMLQSDPGTAPNTLKKMVILEGYLYAENRLVFEVQQHRDGDDGEQV